MAQWLFKSEPDTFSIADLERVGKEPWNGVRNYQARNWLRDSVAEGDLIYFYHSNCPEPGIVGLMRCSRAGHVDASQFDPASDFYDAKAKRDAPRWYQVEVQFVRRYARTLSLAELKARQDLGDLALVRPGNRLSVMMVPPAAQRVIDGLLAP